MSYLPDQNGSSEETPPWEKTPRRYDVFRFQPQLLPRYKKIIDGLAFKLNKNRSEVIEFALDLALGEYEKINGKIDLQSVPSLQRSRRGSKLKKVDRSSPEFDHNFLRLHKTAKYLGIGVANLKALIESGEIQPAFHQGKTYWFRKADLDEFIKG